LIVGLHPESRPLDLCFSSVTIKIRKEIEDVLQVVHDLMVDWQFPFPDKSEIIPDLHKPRMESFQRSDLG
jgi:hypothetical protein